MNESTDPGAPPAPRRIAVWPVLLSAGDGFALTMGSLSLR
ncbi:hypothetical protein [Polaromonas sp. CG9_12]|nr:hypothetical protein [Polaromonas sp. CG_9.11]CDS54275.1 hypothetical protein [Polaromonas sp. CG9_12]